MRKSLLFVSLTEYIINTTEISPSHSPLAFFITISAFVDVMHMSSSAVGSLCAWTVYGDLLLIIINNMKVVILIVITVIATAASVVAYKMKYPQLWYPFYRTDIWGLCVQLTFVPYTTDPVLAVDHSTIYQNKYYITSVFSSCPYTIIYRAEIGTK